MSINEETLMLFALDALEKHEARIVQKKIDKSPTLQAQLQEIQDTLSPVPLSQPPLQPRPELRDAIMASIQPAAHFHGLLDRFSQLFDLSVEASKQVLDNIDQIAPENWQTNPLVPGTRFFGFSGGAKLANASCVLVHMDAGQFFPAHQHQGKEEILVLQGRASDDKNQIYNSGDHFVCKTGSSHSFKIVGDDACIFAVISHQPIKWLWFKSAVDYVKLKR